MLHSGLPEHVGDEEDLVRLLKSSSEYNMQMAKPAAFLPNLKHKNTSVFRHGIEKEGLRKIWQEISTDDRNLHAAAICKARIIREAQLEIESEEPPDKHANLVNWPWSESDPTLQKAKHKSIALVIASNATLIRFT